MYIPAKPVFEILPKPSTKSAKISVTNKGLIPASGTYKIMSQDSAIVPETIEGDQYSDLKPTKDNGVWLLKYTNLPHNKKIKTNIIGSDVVTLKPE